MYRSIIFLLLLILVQQSLGVLRLPEYQGKWSIGNGTDQTVESKTTNDKKVPANLVFYVISDVPYNDVQAVKLQQQINVLPNDAEFLMHVGDIRSGRNTSAKCIKKEYTDVANLLRSSAVPTFIVRKLKKNSLLLR
jgi:hypothetical protein